MDKFNSPYNPKETESRIYEIWEKSGYFAPEARQPRADNPKSEKSFAVVIPPPNVTGSLHMGHALNATIQDIVVRRKRMAGFKTLWLAGTDHAGIATQNVVEKQLRKEGLSRHDLGREKFLGRVWEWKEKYGNTILGQLKKLGASCDWSRTRFTMDEGYAKAVEAAFVHYHERGWIYRGERIVNWCSRCGTSLSDLELEYQEEKGKLWFIRYPFKRDANTRTRVNDANGDWIVVATTRPETMLGDAAVAVNSKDERYKNSIGRKVVLPIQNREISIVADRIIDKEFGTGAVKVTPAHDALDFEIGERHKLERIKIINERGKMIPETAGKICAGAEGKPLKVLECRQAVIAELEKLGLLEKTEDYVHRVAKCYRCGTTIEPLLSKQWFVKMDELAKMAIKAVKSGKIKFHPKKWEKLYFDWLGSIKDWCVSRQIWWGHRLPVWQCDCQTGKNSKFKIQNSKFTHQEQEDNFIVSSEKPPEKCKVCDSEYQQVPDVLDTWFSSALWPFAVFDWPDEKAEDLKTFYPTQFLSTARDIINLWVARMIFSGLEFTGKAPFQDVFVHPTVLAKSGQRMSKSLGTGVDPLDLIEKYGADATRFGLIYQMMGGQDIKFDESHLLAGKKFCNKIWNASRFVSQQIGISNFQFPISNKISSIENLTEADGKILKEFAVAAEEANKNLDKYEFGPALHSLYDFFWHQFCDVYLEASKKQLENPEQKKQTQEILLRVLADSLKLLHPFMPFITEEIWAELPLKDKKPLIVESW